MNCQGLRKIVSESSKDLFTMPLPEELTRHVNGCPACAEYVRSLRELTGFLDRMEERSAPDDLWAGVVAKINEMEADRAREETISLRRKVAKRWLPLPGFLKPVPAWAAAAVLLVLVGGGVYLGRSCSPQPDVEPYGYYDQHVMLSVQDPLADRAAAGLMITENQARTGEKK
jgi:hypothetical protein